MCIDVHFPYTICKCAQIKSMYVVSLTDIRSKYQEGLNSKPLIPDLMNLVAAEVPDKWAVIGVQLGLSPNEVNYIRQSNIGDFQYCFLQVFMSWKDRSKISYTWNTLINVLTAKSVGCDNLASKLRNTLEFQTVNATFTTSSATPDPQDSQRSHSTGVHPPPVVPRRPTVPPNKPPLNRAPKAPCAATNQPSANTATSAGTVLCIIDHICWNNHVCIKSLKVV